ncbi:hypothetical protein ABPG75_011493 [Micractinium tetrahymenae]
MLGQGQGEEPAAAALPGPPRAAVSRLHPAGSSSSSSISQLDTPMARRSESPVLASAVAAAVAAAPPPAAPTEDGSTRGDRDGSVHRSISIHADGSAHGGRRFFEGPTAPGGGAWQADGQQRRDHLAVFMVEDGSTRGGSAAPSQQQQREGSVKAGGAAIAGAPPCSCCGCTCRAGGGGPPANGGAGGASGRRKGDFGQAKVVIEEADERKLFDWGTYFSSLPKKLKGGLDTRLPVPTWRDIFWSWLGAFLGILAVCAMNQWASPEIDIAFVVGSFGASAVLVFAVLESKMSQPRNFLGGQFLSAVVGITVRVIIHQPWIAGPVGMSLALVLMQLTSTTHPPGGATALIASTLTTLPKWHGYSFLITVLVGSLTMQLIALVVNNLDPRRRYPSFWY